MLHYIFFSKEKSNGKILNGSCRIKQARVGIISGKFFEMKFGWRV